MNWTSMNTMTAIWGHIDAATVLIARVELAQRNRVWTESFYSFFRPFSAGLWATLVGTILIAGIIDYFIEKREVKEVELASCIYEYCAGCLFGGFKYPLVTGAAVFQIFSAFFMLVMISACVHDPRSELPGSPWPH